MCDSFWVGLAFLGRILPSQQIFSRVTEEIRRVPFSGIRLHAAEALSNYITCLVKLCMEINSHNFAASLLSSACAQVCLNVWEWAKVSRPFINLGSRGNSEKKKKSCEWAVLSNSSLLAHSVDRIFVKCRHSQKYFYDRCGTLTYPL